MMRNPAGRSENQPARLLEGRVALVTGAAGGIGREIAYRYAAEGARLVASDVDEAGGVETVARIRERGALAIFVRADVSKSGDSEALVDTAVKEFGVLHIAANNAAIVGPSFPVGEYPIDAWDEVIAVNLSGVFYGMRHQIAAMLDAGGGSIVNIASALAQVGFRRMSAYAAAKHGVVGLTRTAALEYGPYKIRVNAVGPGVIEAPHRDDILTPEALDALRGLHALGRLGKSSEVADLVLWLSSEKASFVTGAYYAVDGGYLAQ